MNSALYQEYRARMSRLSKRWNKLIKEGRHEDASRVEAQCDQYVKALHTITPLRKGVIPHG